MFDLKSTRVRSILSLSGYRSSLFDLSEKVILKLKITGLCGIAKTSAEEKCRILTPRFY
jgi:hypothetical protein